MPGKSEVAIPTAHHGRASVARVSAFGLLRQARCDIPRASHDSLWL